MLWTVRRCLVLGPWSLGVGRDRRAMSLLNVSRVFIRYRIEPSDVVRRMYVPVVVCWLCQSKSSDLLGCDLRADVEGPLLTTSPASGSQPCAFIALDQSLRTARTTCSLPRSTFHRTHREITSYPQHPHTVSQSSSHCIHIRTHTIRTPTVDCLQIHCSQVHLHRNRRFVVLPIRPSSL